MRTPPGRIEFKKLQYIILTAEFFCQKKSSPPIPQTSDIYQTWIQTFKYKSNTELPSFPTQCWDIKSFLGNYAYAARGTAACPSLQLVDRTPHTRDALPPVVSLQPCRAARYACVACRGLGWYLALVALSKQRALLRRDTAAAVALPRHAITTRYRGRRLTARGSVNAARGAWRRCVCLSSVWVGLLC